MTLQVQTKLSSFLLKHLLLIGFFLLPSIWQSGQAQPVDPVPMPDEVITALHARLSQHDLPLVQEINLHRQELTGLINQIKELKQKQDKANPDNSDATNNETNKADKKALRASLKSALLGKAHELTVLRDRLSADNANQANMQALITRLNELITLLNETASSRLSKERIAALEQILQSPEAASSVIPNSPPGGFRQDQAQPIPAKPASDQKPAYALQALDQPVMLAALGDNLAAVLPATPDATSCGWVAADMADDGRNVKITQEIKDLAKQLDYSPVKIMEWMNKEISFEPYYGALKGGQGVLYSKAGGPTDIASLTIALLRASNIPARYVTGNIAVLDGTTQTTNSRIQRWLGTKSYTASKNILNLGRFPGVSPAKDIGNNDIGVVFQHVWVEACLPYAHYRGSRLGSGGERWIPLDPAFRNPEYQPGIANSVDINYATYLAKRTNELPLEHYESQLRTYLATLTPARTLDEVGYTAKPNNVRFDVLPVSLPYTLTSYVNWSNSGKPDTAVLPDLHQYRLAIDVKSAADVALGATTNLYMPEIALSRLSLSFKGANASAQSALDTWQRDNSSTSAVPTINVIPSIKVEGVERYTGNGNTITFASTNNKLNLNIYLDEITAVNPAADSKINKAEYTNISAANLHALQAYALQSSNRLIAERTAKLLSAVRANTQPNTTPDNIEGEFLHIVGLKWMKYVQDDMTKLGVAAGTSGWSGFNIGLTSTQAKIQYTFDVPLGVTRTGYLIDAPGVLSRSRDLVTGNINNQDFIRSTYELSSLESYIWQENAHLDAVSTVRGLQFAKEKGIPVLDNVALANWASQSALLQAAPSNASCASAYLSNDLSSIKTNYIDKGFVLKLPQCKINYDGWAGSVFVADGLASDLGMGMIISGGFNGGYSLPPLTSWVNYTPSINTGYSYTTPPPAYTPPSIIYTPPPPPAVISPAINYGITNYTSFAGDPVNLVNGNLYHNERDIAIKGRGGFPIVFERAYNSRDAKDGPLGFGWTHSLNHYITFSTDNPDGATAADDTDANVSSITWVDGTGSQKTIATDNTANTFAIPKGFYFTVSREAGTNRFIITEKSGIKYTFESVTVSAGSIPTANAKLVSVEDRNGNKLNLNYTGNNLTSVVDSLNRTLTLTYTNNRITQITDWTGRQWQYGYDSNGDLTSFKNPRAAASKQAGLSYAYYTTTDGQYLAHMMKSNTLPRGNGMTFEYFINGRVFRHYPTSQPDAVTTFSYNDFRRETVVTEANGHTKHHFFDRFGNPEKTLEDDGGIVSYTYDCRSTDNSDCPNPYARLSETDLTGQTINYEYDAAGNQTKTLFPATNAQVIRTDFAANTFGQPRRIQDARGNWKIVRYDSKGNITDEIQLKAGVTPAACSSAECAIPAAANIALWTQRQYDAFGNTSLVKRVRDFSTQAGPTLATDWNDTTNAVNGLNGAKFTRTGDKNGDGTLDTPDAAIHSYDNLGRVKTGINENWYTVSVTEYDEVDRPTKQIDALGRNVENDFDANGNLTEARIFKGGQLLDRTSTAYDIADRPLFTTSNAGATNSFEYNLQGQTTASTNPDGYQVNMDYDNQGRLIKALDAEGLLTSRDYDVAGRLQSLTNPAGITQTYSYYGPEQQGRLKRSTLPAIQGASAGRASEQDYDANGNVIKSRSIGSDGSIREHLSFYDAQNRLIREVSPIQDTEVVNPVRRQICRVYSNLGDLTELWIGSTTDTSSTSCNFADATLKKQVTYTYDDFGRKIKETDPLGKFWSWTYNINGDVLTQTDAKNQTTTYTYKTGGLIETRKDQAQRLTTWTYDDLGQLKTVGDSNVTYTYGYDVAHRLSSVNDSRGNKTLNYRYSAGGLLNRMIDPENRYTDYIYDDVGRLTGQWLPNDAFFGWGYNSRGLLEVKWSDAGIVTNYDWNEDGSLKKLTNVTDNTTTTGSVTNTHSYTYDAFGALSVDDARTSGISTGVVASRQCYTRTTLGQLKKWYLQSSTATPCTGNPNQVYIYDVFGNRTQVFQGSDLFLYGHDAAQQLNYIDYYLVSNNTPTFQNTQAVFGYDFNGSMTSKQSGYGTLTLTWDELNRLKTANSTVGALGTGSVTSNQSYLYDALDRRISKTITSGAGTSTNYLYDGDDIYTEYASTSWVQPVAINATSGTDQTIARITLTNGQFNNALYLHTDIQGNTDVVTQYNGTGIDTISGAVLRDPWGGVITAQALANNLPDFQGRTKDETGLYNFRARYLDINAVYIQSNDRFISRDPTGYAGGINPYVAFENDPLTYSDPTGTTASINRGLQGLVNQSYYNNISNSLGLTSPSSSYQNLNTVQYAPSAQTLSHTQTALMVASAIPVIGSVASLANAAIDSSQGRYASAAINVATAIPFVGLVGTTAKVGMRTADALLDVARVETNAVNVTLRGSQNPLVAESAAYGRQVHKEWNYGSGFEKEFTLPSGKRPDAINFETREVIELKPNNPRAIQRGVKQVESYKNELEQWKGGCWTCRVETYNK